VAALECWKDRLREITKIFQKITFAHVYREESKDADSLSKHALLQAPGKIVYYRCEEEHEGPH
jgi:hypothetical protein